MREALGVESQGLGADGESAGISINFAIKRYATIL